MSKSPSLNFTQSLVTAPAVFTSSDLLHVIAAEPNSNGTTLTSGTRLFTCLKGTGTVLTGGTDATWTASVSDGRIIGPPTMLDYGTYLTTPQDVATNAATVDSGSSNATWALTVGHLKTLYTAGANDAVIKAIQVASFDSAARIMTLWVCAAATGRNSLLGSVNIPANAGTGSGTTAATDLLNGVLFPALPYDANGKRVIPLQGGWVLKASVPAVTAGKLISVQVMAEAY